MSWTDNNITDPQGDWGQGASNNSIGWGQAAVNTISWGWGHIRSLGHAVTNLLGEVLALTPGFDLYVSENTGTPLNTANQLNATVSTSVITFSDLTGITLTATEGTGVFSISGNTIVCDTSGTLTKITLSNGAVFNITEGVGSFIYSNTVYMIGELTSYTWTLGVASGYQTAIEPKNTYDYFNGNAPLRIEGVNPSIINTTHEIDVVMPTYFAGFDYYYNYYNPTDGRGLAISVNAGKWRFFLSDGANTLKFYQTTVNWESGNRYKLTMTVNADGSDVDCYVNDVLVTNLLSNTAYANTTITNPIIMGQTFAASTGAIGILLNYSVDGVSYNKSNSYGNNYYTPNITTSFVSSVVGGVDAFGNGVRIATPTNGYDFSGQNLHYYDTSTIINHTGASALGFWFYNVSLYPDSIQYQRLFKNDVVEVLCSSLGKLRIIYNGGTVEATNVLENNKYHYVVFYTDGAGAYSIWIGDEDNPMALVAATGTVGIGTTSSQNLVLGSNTGLSYLGLINQVNHHPLPYTITEAENDRTATKLNL